MQGPRKWLWKRTGFRRTPVKDHYFKRNVLFLIAHESILYAQTRLASFTFDTTILFNCILTLCCTAVGLSISTNHINHTCWSQGPYLEFRVITCRSWHQRQEPESIALHHSLTLWVLFWIYFIPIGIAIETSPIILCWIGATSHVSIHVRDISFSLFWRPIKLVCSSSACYVTAIETSRTLTAIEFAPENLLNGLFPPFYFPRIENHKM